MLEHCKNNYYMTFYFSIVANNEMQIILQKNSNSFSDERVDLAFLVKIVQGLKFLLVSIKNNLLFLLREIHAILRLNRIGT